MKKALIKILLILAVLIALICLLSNFVKHKREIVSPLNKDIAVATQQEFLGDEPVNELFDLEHNKEFSADYSYCGYGYKKILFKKRIPERESSLCFTLTCDDGSEFVYYQYRVDDRDYIEIPGVGVYKSTLKHDSYSYEIEKYYDRIYVKNYLDKLESRDFTLSKYYNGAEKAIWIEDDDLYWWDRTIPDDRVALGPQEVRYLILCNLLSKTYVGYWYDPRTGQKVNDHYDVRYSVSVFDLESGKETILVENTEDPVFYTIDNHLIENYFDGQ